MRATRLFAALVVAAGLLAQAEAFAQAPAYTVVTSDGSTYQGQLVEDVVGSHVTLRLATGEIRRFEAGQVARQGPAVGAAPSVQAPTVTLGSPYGGASIIVGGGMGAMFGGALGVAGAPVAYNGPDAVRVHIEGDGQLFQESPNGWQQVCNVPCATTVNPSTSYKLGGFMYRDSRTFMFPTGGPLELVAKPVSVIDLGRSILGWTLAGLGVAPIVPGALFLAGTFDSQTTPGQPRSQTDYILGGVLIGGGAVLLGVGIWLIATPNRTTLETKDGQRIAKRAAPGVPLPGGLLLTPSGLLF